MNILIAQPRLERQLTQLEYEMSAHSDVDVVIFPEGYINHNIEHACELARKHSKIIISGHKNPKDRALIIDREGRILLDRAKYDESALVETEGKVIGLILCDELIIQGMSNMKPTTIDFIVHPIGVGMFSEDQFDEWIAAARKIAIQYHVMIIGTSHADGSFRGSDISIPIAYCIDKDGEDIFVSKNDIRTRILNFDSGEDFVTQ
ncbi:hypothetical protein [Cohnella terricola]|uniref:CN hydrolase domain-containing protein n=1 Tax=Cohnella terricola TaxID=1289167 RepID=A0A559J8W4_9BACL|nr:hypothetical protein [Cohnella terricola]TVX96313.1 hypothetical protein FPZ45_21655 [Cohnella terricola]